MITNWARASRKPDIMSCSRAKWSRPSFPITPSIAFWQHQLRWSRTVRDSRPGGFLGLVFTFGIFWSLLTMLLAGFAAWSLLLFAAVFALRLATAYLVTARVLRDRSSLRSLWLVPLRDLIAVAVWVGALFGNTVVWRGETFRLRGGRLQRLREPGV